MRLTAHVRGVAMAFAVAAGLSVLAVPAAAGDPHPDLSISKTKQGGYVGNNQFDPPTPQSVTKKAKVNKRKEVFIKVQAEQTPGAVELKAPASETTLRLKYFLGGENVTSDITDFNGHLAVVELGETRRLRLEYKPKPGITDVSVIISGQNGPNLDRVRLVLNAP